MNIQLFAKNETMPGDEMLALNRELKYRTVHKVNAAVDFKPPPIYGGSAIIIMLYRNVPQRP